MNSQLKFNFIYKKNYKSLFIILTLYNFKLLGIAMIKFKSNVS